MNARISYCLPAVTPHVFVLDNGVAEPVDPVLDTVRIILIEPPVQKSSVLTSSSIDQMEVVEYQSGVFHKMCHDKQCTFGAGRLGFVAF
jgi:hypothetical protein